MSQRAINMHTSQISHGIVAGEAFVDDGNNAVVVGYTPSMIRIAAIDGAGDPLDWFEWFSHTPGSVFGSSARADAFVETTESGFVLDGLALVAAEATSEGFLFVTYGCDNDGSYRANMNPDPVQADNAMAFIPAGVYDPGHIGALSSETEIEINTVGPDFVSSIDNTALTVNVATATTVDQLLSEIESTDGSTQTYNIYADDTGPDLSAEKTGATAVVSTDWLVVTAEDGTTANYQITVA